MSWKLNAANLCDDPGPILRTIFDPTIMRTVREYSGKARLCAGFTLNGNRTWAKDKWLPIHRDAVIWHRSWAQAVERTIIDMRKNLWHVFDSAFMWGLSVKNLDPENGRGEDEIRGLFRLLKEFATWRWLDVAHRHKAHIFMIWDEGLLNERDSSIVATMNKLSEETAQYTDDFKLAIGLAYDYNHEVTRHIDQMRLRGEQWSTEKLWEQAFQQSHKWLRYPDVAIRTGTDGNRTSWWLVGPNTELLFFRTYWPLFWPLLLRYAAYRRLRAKINDGK